VLSGDRFTLGKGTLHWETAKHKHATPREVWRRVYGMPSNDPRVLTATDDEILIDLLVRFMQDRTTAAESDPSEAARQFVEDNPRKAKTVLKAHEDWLKSPKVQMGIQKLLGRYKEPPTAPAEPQKGLLSLPKSRVRP